MQIPVSGLVSAANADADDADVNAPMGVPREFVESTLLAISKGESSCGTDIYRGIFKQN